MQPMITFPSFLSSLNDSFKRLSDNIIKICLFTKNFKVCWHTIPLVSPQCVSTCVIAKLVFVSCSFVLKRKCTVPLHFSLLPCPLFPKWSSLMIITWLKIYRWFLVSLQKALRMSSWFSMLLKLSYWVSERYYKTSVLNVPKFSFFSWLWVTNNFFDFYYLQLPRVCSILT